MLKQPLSESERAVIVGVHTPGTADADFEASFAELERLLDTAGGVVAAKLVQSKEAPDKRTYIGSGKADELAALCRLNSVKLVVFDCELSPSQIKNLEDLLSTGEEVVDDDAVMPGEPIWLGDIGERSNLYEAPDPVIAPAEAPKPKRRKLKSEPVEVRVIDRSMLILDIFACHAVTNEGKLQVELAQLKYTVPRLTGQGLRLSRQQGGNIAMRGPGETKLETDRRHLKRRMAALQKELDELEAGRAVRRRQRERAGSVCAAITGYTNAGKSTLLNYLTGAGILAEDKLFATLDPTTRQYELPNGSKLLLTDTVGFIRNLPHHLIEAFKSTLDEVAVADIIIVIIDASDIEQARQLDVTRSLLGELGAADKPTLYVYNKCDKPAECLTDNNVSGDIMSRIAPRFDRAVPDENIIRLSAKTGEGVDALVAALERMATEGKREVRYFFPHSDSAALSRLYGSAVTGEPEYTDDGVIITAVTDAKIRGMFKNWEAE